MRLGKIASAERLDAACRRACRLGAWADKPIESSLTKGRERPPVPAQSKTTVAPRPATIRGPQSYQEAGGEH